MYQAHNTATSRSIQQKPSIEWYDKVLILEEYQIEKLRHLTKSSFQLFFVKNSFYVILLFSTVKFA